MPETRSKTKKQKQVAEKQGLNANKILVEGSRRRTKPPDRLGAAPQVHKDGHGNPILLPGSSAIAEQRMKLSGDSGKDIEKLVERTGLGGPGSGQTWHHQADYDPETGQGTVTLMPTQDHQQYHIGGSAQKRATDHGGDPDKLAKYGYGNPQ